MQAGKVRDIASRSIVIDEKNVQVFLLLCALQFPVLHSVSILSTVKSSSVQHTGNAAVRLYN